MELGERIAASDGRVSSTGRRGGWLAMVGYRQQVGEEAGWRWSGIVNRSARRLAGDGRVSSIGWRVGWLAMVGYRQ